MRCKISLFSCFVLLLCPVLVEAQTVNISNGVVGPGHLDVNVDAYGAYGNFNGAYVDNFQPDIGGSSQPTFSAGIRLFSGNDKVMLTDMQQWLDVFGLDAGTWSRNITSAVANSGSDTAVSSFDVMNATGAAVLSFDVTQTASAATEPNVAILDQCYDITNVSGGALDFCINRVLDGDLIWGTLFDDDSVGASNPLGFVSQHEPGSTSQAMALTAGPGSEPFTYYWGAKNTHVPTNGGPAFGFGTDVICWGNGGLPETWRNYVANVGYDTPGDSGVVTGQDGHVGLDWQLSLEDGEAVKIVIRTVYGAESLATKKDCVLGDVNGDGSVDLLDVAPFVALITAGEFQCEADINEDGIVDLLDVAPFVDLLTP